jgi:putative phage-type endonuclease
VTAVELLPPGTGPHDERWHELRRQGVTASEIAAVMGLSKWASPFSLFWQKTYAWTTEETDVMSAGRHLESAIADWWEATNSDAWDPALRLRPAGLYAHPDRPWQLATPDRLIMRNVEGRPGVFRFTDLLECKWLAHSWDGWGEPGTDQIPVHYRAQVLWQADVMGVDEVHIAALGPGGFRAYTVHLDDAARADLEVMRAAGEDFHRRLVEGDAPDLDSHTATLDTLKRLYPDAGEGDIECTPDLAVEYAAARAAKREAEATIAACEALIRNKLGATYRRVTHDGRPVATRSVYEVQRIDTARLRRELPEIAAEYTTTSVTDRLTPGRAEK